MEKAQFYGYTIRFEGKITIKIQLLKRIDIKTPRPHPKPFVKLLP